MLNLYIACCQKLYTQHCHFLYIVNLLVTNVAVVLNLIVTPRIILNQFLVIFEDSGSLRKIIIFVSELNTVSL